MDANSPLILFSCFPDCRLSQLTSFDWLLILFFLFVVYLVASLLRKAAFASFQGRENDWIWHLPRFAYVVFVVSFVTLAPMMMLFDAWVARLYSRTLLPMLCVGIYLAWLCRE